MNKSKLKNIKNICIDCTAYLCVIIFLIIIFLIIVGILSFMLANIIDPSPFDPCEHTYFNEYLVDCLIKKGII